VARAQPAVQSPGEDKPPAAPEPAPPQEAIPAIRAGTKVAGDPAEVVAQLGLLDPRQRSVLHILCPNGHLLETPREMLGQDAMCPHCQVLFRLRLEDSQEYRREKAERRERREQRLGKAWLHWAIATAVVVVLGIVVLVVVAAYR
jgi:hypothetical protein